MKKTYEKYVVFWMNRISPEKVMKVIFFPKREIGNSLVKSMWVNSLHQVNCETKYTILDTADHHQKLILWPMKWQHKFNSLAFLLLYFYTKMRKNYGNVVQNFQQKNYIQKFMYFFNTKNNHLPRKVSHVLSRRDVCCNLITKYLHIEIPDQNLKKVWIFCVSLLSVLCSCKVSPPLWWPLAGRDATVLPDASCNDVHFFRVWMPRCSPGTAKITWKGDKQIYINILTSRLLDRIGPRANSIKKIMTHLQCCI